MDMNKAFFLRTEDRTPQWRVIDATGKVVGRLATEISNIIRGKDKPEYTPHADAGDYVVVINADKVVFTGKKWKDKEYVTYSGWIGGQKKLSAEEVFKRKPEQILHLAVKRMLARNKMSRKLITKVKIYVGSEHPHQAQITTSEKAVK
jgi:large subunit ribosomal protein L13